MCILGTIFTEKKEIYIEDTNYLVSEMLDCDNTLNMFEMLNMYNSKPIIYQTTLALSQTLHLLSNYKEQLASRKEKIMRKTNIFLWNMYLIVGNRMQELAGIIGVIVFGNVEFGKLVNRIIPKAIVNCFEDQKNLPEWKVEEWKNFFKLLQSDHKTATEQWNEQCREELRAALKKTALEFFDIKCNHEEQNINWNYEEFHIKYKFLEERCKVGNYYLKDLLYKNEADQYSFSKKIEGPDEFCTVILIPI